MNNIFMLYKLDYECPELINVFESQDLAYNYAKNILNGDIVLPIDKSKKRENYSFHSDYFIKEHKILSKLPKTYVEIHTSYDYFNDTINTETFYSDSLNKTLEDEYSNSLLTSMSFHEIDKEFNLKSTISKQKQKLKENLVNTVSLAITNDGNYYIKDFFEKFTIHYNIDGTIRYFKDDIEHKSVLLGMFKKREDQDIQSITKSDFLEEIL